MSTASVGAQIGPAVGRLRRERRMPQEHLEAALRTVGIAWPPSTISRFENGRRDLSAGELLMLPLALRLAFGRPVRWPELLGDRETIQATDVGFYPVQGLPRDRDIQVHSFGIACFRPDGASRRAARRLRLTQDDIDVAAQALWGRPLTEERERRVLTRRLKDSHLTLRGLRSAVGRDLIAEMRHLLELPG